MALFSSGVGVYADSSASTDTEVQLNVDTVINISTPDTTTINCASLNTLCTANTTITVGTNNITGYTLQLNATSGYSNSLTNAATSETIPTLSGAYASGSFPTNYWGYTGGLDKSGETGGLNCSANYCPILAYQSDDSNYTPNHAIKVTDAPATASNTTITFGAKADITKPSGTYTTSVTFTAITNYAPHSIINGMYMQDINPGDCAATPLYSVSNTAYTAVDARDNEEYIIARLADGNCWMLDNMRLDLTDSTVLNSLTTDNTNADSASLTGLKTGNRSAGNRYASSGFEIWDSNHTTNQYYRAKANADYKNTTTTSYGAGSGKIGVYYNYCAASAGNYCYNSVAGIDDTSTLQDAQYDICPKNWRIPTSTADGEYQALYVAYSSNATDFKTALSTPLSGYFNSGSASNQGSRGTFWSSTWEDANSMKHLTVGSFVSPSSSSSRGFGYSVRCLIPST